VECRAPTHHPFDLYFLFVSSNLFLPEVDHLLASGWGLQWKKGITVPSGR
jgi:hypothetical protein